MINIVSKKYFLCSCFFLVFVLFTVLQFLNIGLTNDDAIFSLCARNIAIKHLYALPTGGKDVLFDIHCHMGWILIFTQAVMIKLFSNKYWLPSFTAIMLNSAMLLSIFYFSSKLPQIKPHRYIVANILFLILLAFTASLNNEVADGSGFPFFATFLSEIPISLLLILSAILFTLGINDSKKANFGALLAGIAFSIKSIAIIFVAPMFLVALYLRKKNKQPILIQTLVMTMIFLAPTIVFMIYQISVIGIETFFSPDTPNNINAFFYELGLGNFKNVISGTFFDKYGYNIINDITFVNAILTWILPLGALAYLIKTPEINENKWFTIIISIPILTGSLWYFPLAYYVRNYEVIWVLYIASLCLSVLFIEKRHFKILCVPISCLFLAFHPINMDINNTLLKKQEIEQAESFILKNSQYRFYGQKNFMNRELQYLLPIDKNIYVFDLNEIKKNPKNNVLIVTRRYAKQTSSQIYEQTEKKIKFTRIFGNQEYLMFLLNYA